MQETGAANAQVMLGVALAAEAARSSAREQSQTNSLLGLDVAPSPLGMNGLYLDLPNVDVAAERNAVGPVAAVDSDVTSVNANALPVCDVVGPIGARELLRSTPASRLASPTAERRMMRNSSKETLLRLAELTPLTSTQLPKQLPPTSVQAQFVVSSIPHVDHGSS